MKHKTYIIYNIYNGDIYKITKSIIKVFFKCLVNKNLYYRKNE